jgi:hypothetical protein
MLETKSSVMQRIDSAARRVQSANPTLTLHAARDRVLSENPELYRAFKEAPEPEPARSFSAPAPRSQTFEEAATGRVDAVAHQLMLQNPRLSIHQARLAALSQRPEFEAAINDSRRRDGAGLWQQGTGALPAPPSWYGQQGASVDAMSVNASPQDWPNWVLESPLPGQPRRGQPMPMVRAAEELTPERQERAVNRLIPELSQVFSERGLPPPSQVLAHFAARARERGA